MSKTIACVAGSSVLCLCLCVTAIRSGLAPAAADPNKGWLDYDDLTETERLKERPGNYELLGVVADFLAGIHRIRPDYRRCAYPFFEGSRMYATRAEFENYLDEWVKERPSNPRNKLRQFNVNVKSLTIHDANAVSESPNKILKHKSYEERFAEVRKRHPGRAVLVVVDLELPSLQSSKVSGTGDSLLFMIHSGGQWQVAWFQKG